MHPRNATLAVKALMLAVAIAAAAVALAAPAMAGKHSKNVSARIDFGRETHVYGAFHHKGDWIQLVDSCRDKAVSYIKVRRGKKRSTYYVAKKGQPHRCGTRWVNREFKEDRSIGISVCIATPGGRDTCTPWRWGIT